MLSDIRLAVRGLRKAPALSAVAIASLALGIGPNVTMFSAAREMILDDVSATQPDRLARVDTGLTYALYRDLRGTGIFEDVAFHTGFHDEICLVYRADLQNSTAARGLAAEITRALT